MIRNQLKSQFYRTLLFVVLLIPVNGTSATPANHIKNILVLHSYHKGLGWTDNITRGIESTLAKGGFPYELFYEYLDAKRIDDKQHIENLARLFKHKYKNRHLDCIILSDDFAFTFVLRYHDEIFPETPVVFCGVNYFKDSMIVNRPYITGVVEAISIKGTIDGALHINPDINTVYVINDDTDTGRANRKLVKELIPSYKGRLNFKFSPLMTMAALRKTCSTLPSDTIVLLMNFTSDAAGNVFSLERSADLITRDCNRQVYSLWDFHLNHGVMGGKLTTGVAHGEKAAELALRILSGEPADSIPVVKESPNRYIFDYNILRKFHISESRLPFGSTVINKPVSFYTQYKAVVWQVIILIALLIAIIFSISINLMKRKFVEKALRRSEDRLRAIFRAAETVSFIITDVTEPVPKIIEFSPGAEKIFGYSRDEIIGTPVSILDLSEDMLQSPKIHNWMQTDRQGNSSEKTLTRKNGEHFPALCSTHPLLDEEEKMWAVLRVSIDISSQKRTEAALQESTERFRELSELLPETIYEIDTEGKILFLNKSGLNQFHLTPEDLSRGLNAADLFSDEEQVRLKQNMKRILTGQVMGLNEYTAHDRTGKTFPVITKSTLIQKDGKPVGLRGFLIDISDKKRLEEKFNNAQRMESIGTLAGGIAHDFNNLLMGIQGRSSLALLDAGKNEKLREHLLGIEEYVKSASNLTTRLLGFARSGKYHLKVTNMNEMIVKTSEMFGRTRKELSLTRTLQEDLQTVKIDRNQMEQVLVNLYVNAWQAMPNGGRLEIATCNTTVTETEAEAHVLSPGEYVLITVTDTGTGIDEKIQAKIFEPFFTTKERGRGTGLGLASAYGIIRNHHGAITVQSKKDKGASFFIYLPITNEKPAAETVAVDELVKGDETILLVDDEPMIADVGSELLSYLGYTVHIAGSGKEAVNFYARKKDGIDLVILDMIMPELSGEETFNQLKAINPHVKVLLSSGYSLDGQAEKILARGCSGFIQKPFDLITFSRKLREIFASSLN